MFCHHVYQNTGFDICPACGKDTHEIDWVQENKLHKEWLKKNPLAYKTVGWWSI